MSKILELRDAIIEDFQSEAGEGERFAGVTFSTHGGEFDDVGELEKYAKRTPHVVLTVLRVNMDRKGGEAWAQVFFGLFVVADNKQGLPRTEGAVALVDNVLEFVTSMPARTWGDYKSAVLPIAHNGYHKELDKKGIAIWGIFWDQDIKLAPPTPLEYPDLEGVDISWDLHPRDNDAELNEVPDAADTIDLTE